jgi:hypothetical protein
MTVKNIPESHLDLISDEVRSYAYLATSMPDGSPQITPVWFNTDGENILLNSVKGRVKDRNMRARPKLLWLFTYRGSLIDISSCAAKSWKLPKMGLGSISIRFHKNIEVTRITN